MLHPRSLWSVSIAAAGVWFMTAGGCTPPMRGGDSGTGTAGTGSPGTAGTSA